MRWLRNLLVSFFIFFSSSAWCQTDPIISSLISQVSSKNLTSHIQTLANADGNETRASFTDGNRWAVNYIKESFEAIPGLTSVVLDTFFITNAIQPYNFEPLFNVVATLEGKTEPGKIYVVGGHLDATGNLDPNLNWETDWLTAKAPGADDNASGVAATLEIARVLADPNNNFQNDFTLKFVAFGAEERHPAYNNQNHLGSKHFVMEAFQNGEEILGAFILDMIGYNDTGNHYFNIVSDNRSRELGEKLLESNSIYQVNLSSNQLPFPSPTYSDHDQFWLYRYKAVLLIENAPPWQNNMPFYRANPFYHRQTDALGTVNVEQVEKITKVALATVASLARLVTSVEEDTYVAEVPETFALFQNYPNPFNAGTLIEYELSAIQPVGLKILNLKGQRIATLVNEIQAAGEFSINWNGRDENGVAAASGIYLYSLKVGERVSTRKMLLLK